MQRSRLVATLLVLTLLGIFLTPTAVSAQDASSTGPPRRARDVASTSRRGEVPPERRPEPVEGLVEGPAEPSGRRSGQSATEVVHIFFSGGCADCWPYVEETLVPALKEAGLSVEPEIHDFTRPGGRQLLADQAAKVGLPRSIADSLYAFVPWRGSQLILLGHIPRNILDLVLTYDDLPERLV
ncbi:MAG: hypothetical protein ACE5F6_18425, partial [Anaerolineae bacterium]